MKITRRQIKFISAVVLLTTFLTWFFYAHETLPKPIRAATALMETPVAIASGLSYYLKLGIPVYDTPWAIILANLLCSVLVIYLVEKLLNRWKKRTGQCNELLNQTRKQTGGRQLRLNIFFSDSCKQWLCFSTRTMQSVGFFS